MHVPVRGLTSVLAFDSVASLRIQCVLGKEDREVEVSEAPVGFRLNHSKPCNLEDQRAAAFEGEWRKQNSHRQQPSCPGSEPCA